MTEPAPIAVYVHWPYCARICPYCDFNVVRDRGRKAEQAALAAAIIADLEAQAARIGARRLVSVFFGGGTPSLMDPDALGRVVETARRLFPADARTPRGIASEALLREVVVRLAGVGLRPASLDLVLIGARPRLGSRLDAMRAPIAGLLGIDEDAVNVKASTGNLAGDEGAGRSISARAVATLRGTTA